MKHFYVGILFFFLSCSFDWPSGGKDGHPSFPAKSIPFTCDGIYFIRLEKADLGASFSIGDAKTNFYCLGKDKIYKYDLNSLQVIDERSFIPGVYASYFAPLNNQTGWLLTSSLTNNISKRTASLLDTNGTIITTKELEDPPNGYVIAGTPDNGFLLGANPPSVGVVDRYSVSRYSDKGVLQWKKEFTNYGRIRKVLSLSTGGFLIGGFSDTTIQGVTTHNSYLAKLDNEGNLLWQRTGDLNNSYGIHDIVEDSSGDYYLLISRPSTLSLIRSDSAFAIKWTTTIDNPYSFSDAKLTMIDNDMFVHYSAGKGIDGSNDIYLASISDNGIVHWERKFGGTGDEIPYSLFRLQSSGYCLIGKTKNWDGNGVSVSRGYMIKTDMDGNSCK